MPDTAASPATSSPAPQTEPAPVAPPAKWWGESMTIWGALLTAVTTVAPAILSAFGIEISAEILQKLGSQTAVAVQALIGLAGTLLTIFGRLRATATLERRTIKLHL